MDTAILPRLVALYGRLPRRLTFSRTSPESVASDLCTLYGLGYRHYHNMKHIEECLHEFDGSVDLCIDPLACEMAIWYHDVVYEPTSNQNERLSSNKATFDCLRLGVTDEVFKDAIVRIILGTKHTSQAKDDTAVVADIDLSILGKPWERFSEYERQIREEYSHIPDKDFVAGRMAILDGFLRKPSIYWTDHFREKYEKVARANIALSIRKFEYEIGKWKKKFI